MTLFIHLVLRGSYVSICLGQLTAAPTQIQGDNLIPRGSFRPYCYSDINTDLGILIWTVKVIYTLQCTPAFKYTLLGNYIPVLSSFILLLRSRPKTYHRSVFIMFYSTIIFSS